MKQTLSIQSALLLVGGSLLIPSVVSDQAQAQPIYFEFAEDQGGLFRCPGGGNGCSFRAGEWPPSLPTGESSVTAGLPFTAWTSQAETDTLGLSRCREADCFVECNAGCTCVLETERTEACPEVDTVPPTASPTTDDTPRVCLAEKDTALCGELMDAVPAGNSFDCYNFCGGRFITSCDFSTDCMGDNTCEDQGEDGTALGTVLGCTDSDRPLPGEGSTSGASSLSLGLLFAALLAAVMIQA